jgi:hypothetical protein
MMMLFFCSFLILFCLGRPDDWETFLQYLCLLLEEDINWSRHATGGYCPECISLSKSKLSEEEVLDFLQLYIMWIYAISVRNQDYQGYAMSHGNCNTLMLVEPGMVWIASLEGLVWEKNANSGKLGILEHHCTEFHNFMIQGIKCF